MGSSQFMVGRPEMVGPTELAESKHQQEHRKWQKKRFNGPNPT
jgi:hypothetical protein